MREGRATDSQSQIDRQRTSTDTSTAGSGSAPPAASIRAFVASYGRNTNTS